MSKKIPKFEAGSWSYVDAPSTPRATTPVLLACDIKNWPRFAKLVCDPVRPDDAVANIIHWNISDETKRSYEVEGPLSHNFQTKFLNDLNDFIHEPGFYDSDRFAELQLADKTKKQLWESGPESKDVVRFNSLLLQDSFPQHVSFVPFIGPRPFEEADGFRFFGRDREAREFVLRIVANPEVLLFAPSGAGKSSLIRANLIPMLRERDCHVLPVGNVHAMALQAVAKDKSLNPFVLSFLICWSEGDDRPGLDDDSNLNSELDLENLKSMTLSDYFQNLDEQREGEPQPKIVFLDQFEEVFAYGRHQQLIELFEQLSDALDADPTLRIVFSMRGDRIDQFAKYIPMLPQQLPVRLRLDMLDENAALDAITKPLEYTHRSFAPGVAEELVKTLRTVRVKNFEQKFETIEEDVVEPVQLQVVCQSLWESLPPDVTVIRQQHVREFANVDDALAAFYERCITGTVEKTKFPEGVLRQWFSRELITPGRTRGIVFRGKKRTENMPNRVVDFLSNLYIIRRELFGKQPWYRLAHDRFIEPILQSNKEWEQRAVANVAPMVKQLKKRTIRWKRSNRSDKELLRDEEIISAEKCLAVFSSQGVEIDEFVQEFVSASKAMALQIENERSKQMAEVQRLRADEQEKLADAERLNARYKNYGMVALGILLLAGAVVAWVLVGQERRISENLKETSANLASKSGIEQVKNGNLFKGMLWYQQAIKTDKKPGYQKKIVEEDERRRATHQVRLNSVLMQLPRLNQLWVHPRYVTKAEFSPDRERAVCIFKDGLAKIFDGLTGKSFLLQPPDDQKFSYAKFGPHGRIVLTVSGDQVQLWDASTGLKRGGAMKHAGNVTRAWFSPRTDFLLTSTYQPPSSDPDQPHSPAQARLWNIQQKDAPIAIDPRTSLAISSACFDSDGKRVFIANGKNAELRDTRTLEIIGKTNTEGRGNQRSESNRNTIAETPEIQKIETIGKTSPVKPDSQKSESNGKTFSHASNVVFVSLSKDGNRGVTVTQDQTVSIWNLESGKAVNSRGTGKPGVSYLENDVAIFKDKLLVKSDDNVAWLWTLPNRQINDLADIGKILTGNKKPVLTKTFQHRAPIKHMAFSPDGKQIVTCSEDSTAQLWKASDGSLEILEHEHDVNQAAFSPDGRFLATAGRDNTARIWNVETRALVHAKLLHNDSVSHVSFDKDGLQLWTINTGPYPSKAGDNRNGEVRRWDLYTKNVNTTHINHPEPMTWSELSSDGKLVVSAGLFGSTIVSSATSGRIVYGPFIHASPVTYATFSPNCKRVASCGMDGTVQIWDLENNSEPASVLSLDGEPRYARFDESGKRVLTVSHQPVNQKQVRKKVQLWELESDDCIFEFEKISGSDIENMAEFSPETFSANVKCVAFVIENSAVNILNFAAGKKTWTLHHDKKQKIRSLNFSANGTMLVTASTDDTARIWDIKSQSTKQMVPSLRHSSDVNDARFSFDGSKVVTASSDRNVRTWNARTGDPMGLPLKHRSPVISTRFCRNDDWLVTLCEDKKVHIWDANSSNPVTPPLVHPKDLKGVTCVENETQNETVISVIGFDDSERRKASTMWSTANVTPTEYEVSVSRWPIGEGVTPNQAELIELFASHRLDENGLFPLDSAAVKAKWGEVSDDRKYRHLVGSAGSSSPESRLRQIVTDCEVSNDLTAALFNLNALISLKKPDQFKSTDWGLFARRCRMHFSLGDQNAAAKDYDYARRLAVIKSEDKQALMDWLGRQAEDWLWADVGNASQNDGRSRAAFFPEKLEQLQEGDESNWLLHAQLSLPQTRQKGVTAADGMAQEAVHFEKAKTITKATPDRIVIWLKRQLHAATALGQHETQGFLLDQLIEFNPDDWKLKHRRAEEYLRLSDYEGALEKLNKAIELNTDSWKLFASRAETLGNLGVQNYNRNERDLAVEQFKAAIADYSSAIKQMDSQNERYDLYRYRATYYKNIGRFDKAIEDYWSAFSLIPRNEKSFVVLRPIDQFFRELEDAYRWHRDWRQAVVDLTREIDSYPEHYPPEAGLFKLRGKAIINSMLPGKQEINSENLQLAHADFYKAIELSAGQSSSLRTELAAAYVQQEDWENAERELTKSAELSTDNFITLENLARIYLAAEKQTEYRHVCEQLTSKFGSEDFLHLANDVAWTCALAPDAISDLSVAVNIARSAVAQNESNRYYLNTLGAVLYRNGDYEEAIQMLNKAIAADTSGTKPVWDAVFLAMCHYQRGESNQADERLTEAIEWSKEFEKTLLWKERIELQTLLKEAKSLITQDQT